MAGNLGGGAELRIRRQWRESESNKPSVERRGVPVIYYLCRHGQLEHPHFMEVPLSSPDGLYLRDVIKRLNILRGNGMADMYSWSSKRSYKNGFVWQDLGEDDFIHPAHGEEHILKGSELLQSPLNPTKSQATAISDKALPTHREPPAVAQRRNQSWSSSDFQEYHVYKADHCGRQLGGLVADAATQTDDQRRSRKPASTGEPEVAENPSTELSREEISPPPSDSSPETLESLMKADGTMVCRSTEGRVDDRNLTVRNLPRGRFRASTVLMQLISCGSSPFFDGGGRDHRQNPGPFTADDENNKMNADNLGLARGEDGGQEDGLGCARGVISEGKSLLVTRQEETFAALKRSSSGNVD